MESIKRKLWKCDSPFSISTDIATTKGMTQSFLGICAHFHDKDTRSLRCVGVALVPSRDSHTAKYIGGKLYDALSTLKLSEEKVFRVVTDSALNMKAAFL
jgi:hypothetical protein